jgi:hypothetical protein
LGFRAGEFLGVVARFAESRAIVQAGRAVVVPGNDVVKVADRGVAVGRPAGVVADLDKTAQRCGEEPPSGDLPAAGRMQSREPESWGPPEPGR